MTKLKLTLIALTVTLVLAAGCSGNNNAESPKNEVKQEMTAADNKNDTTAEEPPVEEATPIDTTTLANTSGKTLLKSVTLNKNGDGGHTSIGIVSKGGTVIVADPNKMPTETTGLIKADIVTISHEHSDHTDDVYLAESEKAGEFKLSQYAVESFTVKDVTVTGIASGHSSIFMQDAPSNIIYVYEIDGLRIAHMGDLAQNELTEEQLTQLGKLDVVFLPFSDVSEYGFATAKTVKVLQQLQPKIVSPLHYTPEAVEVILQELGITERSEADELAVDKAELDQAKGMSYVLLK